MEIVEKSNCSSTNIFCSSDQKARNHRKRIQFINRRRKRFYQRNLTKKETIHLIKLQKCWSKNFDKFHNYGYKGLYNGETADDIAKRKGLRYREDVLDNMGSDELIANLFRI